MTVVQIPNLPATAGLNGSEQLEAVQSGTSVKITVTQLQQFISGLLYPGVTQIDTTSPISGGPIITTGTISLQSGGVTNSYLANMATLTVKANITGGSAAPSDVTLSALLDAAVGTTRGTLAVRGASSWQALTSGTNGQVLTANGTTSTPSWQTLNVPSGNISPTGVVAGTYGSASNVPVFSVLASGQIDSVTNTAIAINTSAISGLAPSATIDTTDANNISFGALASGRYSSTLSAAMDAAFSNAHGAIIYRGASNWVALPAGTAGQLLQTQGPGADPSWFSAGSGSVVQVNTGTGLTGGPITAVGTISIANTGVTASTYGSSSVVPVIAVNAQGQITSATNTTIDAVTLTTGTISTTPVNSTDIANKSYVDSVAQGLFVKSAVLAATTADIALSGAQTIDGVSVTSGDRVLVKNQTAQAENGIYVAALGAWARASDMNTWSEVPGAFVFVQQGSTQADTGWVCTSDAGGTIGFTPIVWAQFSGAGTYSAGTGLTLSGTTFSITNTGVSASTYGAAATVPVIAVNAQGQITSATNTSIAINANQITSGTVTVAQGGTGAVTLTGYVKGSGTSAFTASATIPNTDISGLGTMSTQNANSVAVTGGNIDGTIIGGTTKAAGGFTTLNVTGNASMATIIAGTWNGNAVGIAYGGTGVSTTPTNGQLLIGNGTGYTVAALSAGSGIGVSNGAGAITISNSGVLSNAAGTGISVSGSTGAVTITNTGVTSAVAGTGISVSGATGAVTFTNTGVTSLTAGTNISLSGSTGSVTVNTTNNPAFSTSTTTPIVYGGTSASSSLTLQSTSGSGTTDSVLIKVGNNGSVTALSVATTGIVSLPTTGAITVPVGTTAQRPTAASGMLRFNSTTSGYEGYNGTSWGALGGAANGIFWENDQTVTSDYTITTNKNAGTFGPVTINSGVTVTVPSGSVWTVV